MNAPQTPLPTGHGLKLLSPMGAGISRWSDPKDIVMISASLQDDWDRLREKAMRARAEEATS